jgi:hypothetical protein
LTLKTLRDHINNGHLEELAAIEFAVHLLYKEKVSVTVATDSFQSAGGGKLNPISLDELYIQTAKTITSKRGTKRLNGGERN